MVDALGPTSSSAQANQTQALLLRNPDSSVNPDGSNGINAVAQDGVEVILTQAERTAEELTYENLRPRSTGQGSINFADQGENAADDTLRSDTLNQSRL